MTRTPYSGGLVPSGPRAVSLDPTATPRLRGAINRQHRRRPNRTGQRPAPSAPTNLPFFVLQVSDGYVQYLPLMGR